MNLKKYFFTVSIGFYHFLSIIEYVYYSFKTNNFLWSFYGKNLSFVEKYQ